MPSSRPGDANASAVSSKTPDGSVGTEHESLRSAAIRRSIFDPDKEEITMLKKSLAPMSRMLILVLLASLGVILAACSQASSTPDLPAATVPPPTLPAQTAVSITPAAPSQDSPAPTGPLRLVLDPANSEARYRVREQLANISFPTDAVGTTRAISGTIVMEPDGTVVSQESKFIVDLTTLKSDKAQRDRYIQNNTLQTRSYPTAEFIPTKVIELPSPLPTSGTATFQLAGDLTVHGITRPATWDVTASVDGQGLTGSASTSFTFEDFGMTPPRVPILLSVEDTIKLEVDFHLVLDTSGTS
jgi:polyisoprenoid-binding protein YceI